MIDRIIKFSIHNKAFVMLLTLAIVIGGVWSMKEIPLDATPDITNNQVQIITVSPNLGTEDIEQFVTYPVELGMANLPGVEDIRSTSRFGLSVVTVVFNDNMKTYLPRQLVSEKLQEVKNDIPVGFGEPSMGPISTGLGEIYQYTLEVDESHKKEYSITDLRTIQDWIVKRQMAMVPGVIEVNSMGGASKQYEVKIDPNRLQSIGLTLNDVFTALQKNNENTGGAYIERDHKANYIRGEGLARSIEDIEEVVVTNRNGLPVTVKDVASVGYSHAVRYGALTKDGRGEAVGGIVMMVKDANSNKVIKAVKQRMSDIQKSLPEGISIEPFLDRSKLIKQTTSTVSQNLIEGGLIVIFILVLLLGNFRGGLIVASTIPLSLLFAFILMRIFGVWANLMSLGAIDFGIIVDGAVIIVESVVYTLSTKFKQGDLPSQKEMDQITSVAATKLMNSAFFGQFIILIVFVPLLALQGVEGKMFQPMALTFGFALLGAMLLCLTYVPAVSAQFIRPNTSKKQSLGQCFVVWLEDRFEIVLKKSIQYGKWIISFSIVLLVLALWGFNRLGGEFMPQLDEGDLAFHVILKPGSSLTETVETTTHVEKVLKDNFPEIEHVVCRIGVADVPTDPMPMDLADAIVVLKPMGEWTSATSKEELVDKMKDLLKQIPGVNYEFTQPMEMRFNELLTGVREDIAIKLYGEDLDILAQKAQEIGSIIKNIEGVADSKVEATAGMPEITICYNRHRMAQYNLNISDINTLVSTAYAGGKAGVIFEGEKRFDLVVRLEESFRTDIKDVQELRIPLGNGDFIALKEVADVSYKPGPMQISRENTNRRTYVGINVRGRDVEGLVKEIETKLDTQLTLPPGYYIRYGGAFENMNRAKERLVLVVPLALGLILVLIFFALHSGVQTLVTFFAIPMATIGGVFALQLRNMPFSISAGVGFIVLFGVAVLNGLVLLNSLNELKKEGVPLNERIVLGVKHRIRPILLTASTDILGFFPMAISSGAGAEVQRPLATVVIGGLFTATLLTLFFLPIVYKWIEQYNENKKTLKPERRFMKKRILGILLCMMILSVETPSYAQESNLKILSLEDALMQAQQNYPSLKIADLEIKKQEVLKSSVWNFGSTDISSSADYLGKGKENSEFSYFSIGQSGMQLLSVGAKSKLYNKQIEALEQWKEVAVNDLMKEVAQTWYTAVLAQKKLQLANRLDSVYSDYQKAAELRYQTEATNKLELLNAQNKYMRARLTKQQAEQEYLKCMSLLSIYVSDTLFALPLDIDTGYSHTEIFDSKQNPTLRAYTLDAEVANANIKAEKRALLPTFDVQYSYQAEGGEGKYSGYSVGVSIPLFNGQRSQMRAAKIEQQTAQEKWNQQNIELEKLWINSMRDYKKYLSSVQFYKTQALRLANEQVKFAILSYKEGAIDYIALSSNLEEALAIEQSYIEQLELLLQTELQIKALSGEFTE